MGALGFSVSLPDEFNRRYAYDPVLHSQALTMAQPGFGLQRQSLFQAPIAAADNADLSILPIAPVETGTQADWLQHYPAVSLRPTFQAEDNQALLDDLNDVMALYHQQTGLPVEPFNAVPQTQALKAWWETMTAQLSQIPPQAWEHDPKLRLMRDKMTHVSEHTGLPLELPGGTLSVDEMDLRIQQKQLEERRAAQREEQRHAEQRQRTERLAEQEASKLRQKQDTAKLAESQQARKKEETKLRERKQAVIFASQRREKSRIQDMHNQIDALLTQENRLHQSLRWQAQTAQNSQPKAQYAYYMQTAQKQGDQTWAKDSKARYTKAGLHALISDMQDRPEKYLSVHGDWLMPMLPSRLLA